MSVEAPRDTVDGDRYSRAGGGYDDERGAGLLTFAGVMLMIVGIVNFIGGIAAIDNANFYIGSADFVVSNLETWGWVVMITGVVQVLAAFGVLARNQPARWLGVFFASLNMLAQFLLFPAQPLWSLMIIAVDTLIIYGLIAYGGRERAS
jgi:hypothetical protein